VAAVLVSSATALLPAAARPAGAAVGHKLIVAVEKSRAAAADTRLAVLVLISRNGGAPAGAVATPSTPLSILLDHGGPYRVRVEIDSSCEGRCAASYRVSGSADHRLDIVPSCKPSGSRFVCSKLELVEVY
jgi:hypothetical protein